MDKKDIMYDQQLTTIWKVQVTKFVVLFCLVAHKIDVIKLR